MAPEQQAAVETWGVRKARLKCDVRCENIARAGGAELSGRHAGLEEEEDKVGVLIRRDIGNKCGGGVGGVST